MKKRILAALAALIVPASAFAWGETTWTPLIESSYFTGIRADLLLAVGGIISLLLIIAGVSVLAKVFR